MKEIPLTHGKVAIVDDEDFDELTKFRWHYSDKGYVRQSSFNGNIGRRNPYMHRVILSIHDPKILVDHVNGNPLDNRKSNLRSCTRSQNMCNRGSQATNKSGFKGVSRHKKAWRAQIQVHRRNYNLGSFATPEEAHAAYMDAASLLHGEFANAGLLLSKNVCAKEQK